MMNLKMKSNLQLRECFPTFMSCWTWVVEEKHDSSKRDLDRNNGKNINHFEKEIQN